MVCVCSMLTIGSAQVAFAGPSTGYESDMVATVAADLSIYADEDENSEVVAMAEKLSLIHISEPTRPERISYAVFCLKKKFF